MTRGVEHEKMTELEMVQMSKQVSTELLSGQFPRLHRNGVSVVISACCGNRYHPYNVLPLLGPTCPSLCNNNHDGIRTEHE